MTSKKCLNMGVTRELHLFLLDSFFIPIGLTAVQHVRAGRGAGHLYFALSAWCPKHTPEFLCHAVLQ